MIFSLLHLFQAWVHINRVSKSNTSIQSNTGGNRFWIEKIPLSSFNNSLSPTNIDSSGSSQYDIIRKVAIQSGIEVDKIDVGMVILPSNNIQESKANNDKRVVPIHDGMFQVQHAGFITNDDVIVCGFFPRASHSITDTSEDENRPIDEERYHAINHALLTNYGIHKDDLLNNEEYTGTPPSRIYRSFVLPRNKANYLLESVEKAANRTATQIDMALRQIRADAATYLRNTDKESLASESRLIQPVVFVLDNLRSAFNVGSIFRTSETGGVAEIVTVGITAHGSNNQKLRKTAFSSLDVVPSVHFDDIINATEYLKNKGYKIVVLETTCQSQLYTDVDYPEKVALVVGNELTGVDTRVIENIADYVVEIPTYGVKNSLNVASAAPIVLYEVLRQYSKMKKNSGIS